MNQREPRDIDRNRQTQGEKYENNGRKFIFSKSFTSSSTRMICRSNPDKPGTEICTTTTTRSVYNPQTRKNVLFTFIYIYIYKYIYIYIYRRQ